MRSSTARGFTLIELVVVMLVTAILAMIAVSAYSNSVMKSRRTDAKSALLDLAGREERNLSTTNTYSDQPPQLGYTGAGFPIAVGSGYYMVNVVVGAAAPGVPPTFIITATPVGTQAQDTTCALFQVDQTGLQSAFDAGGADQTATCWR
jgi:type IV pilus assembly protein PilE